MTRRVTPTYTLLNQITLAATASSVTFSNIPQNFSDLVVQLSATTNTSVNLGLFRINGDSGSNYVMAGMRGNGSGVASYGLTTTNAYFDYAGDTAANTITTSVIHFLDYSAVDKHKMTLTRQSNANDVVEAMCQRWASTSAITSLTFYWNSGLINSGSTFSLYGVVA